MSMRYTSVIGSALFLAGAMAALATEQHPAPAAALGAGSDRLSEWTLRVEDGVLKSRVRAISERGVQQRVVVDLIMKESRIGKIGDPQVMIIGGAGRDRSVELTNTIVIPEPEKVRAVRVTLFERPWHSKEPFRPADARLVEVSEIRGAR